MLTLPSAFVGVDVSSATLDVALHPQGEHWTDGNHAAGLEACLARLRGWDVQAIVMEATGGLERAAANRFREEGYVVHVVNPRRIHHWRQVVAQNAKTDRIDALLIAEFAATVKLAEPFVLTMRQQQLRDLAARREQLVRLAADAKKQRLRNDLPAVVASLERHIAFCRAEIDAIEKEMRRHFHEDATLRQQRDLLVSIPGVGELSAMLILAELPEIAHLPAKKLASLVGVAPHPRESGKRKGMIEISGGRTRIRTKCYILTHNAIRYNPWLAQYAARLAKRGKSRREVVVASINKLLHLAHSVLKRQTPWQHTPPQIA